MSHRHSHPLRMYAVPKHLPDIGRRERCLVHAALSNRAHSATQYAGECAEVFEIRSSLFHARPRHAALVQ